MTNIRRFFKKGDYCFLTHVTNNRQPILIEHFDLLSSALTTKITKDDVEIISWVVLPDHIHLLLSQKSNTISNVMKQFKLSFSAKYRIRNKCTSGRIWQNRFWDHIIRDENDLNNHIDYIHFNPVKHGHTNSPWD